MTELRRPLSDLVIDLCRAAQVDEDEIGDAMTVTALGLDMPLELRPVITDGGRLEVRASPPTQRVVTTFLPVFHRLRVRIVGEWSK